MTIIGGTYDEACFEPRWDYKFGSGLRAVCAVQGINHSENIIFHTFGEPSTKLYLETFKNDFLALNVHDFPYKIRFEYDFPLSVPHIYPRLDIINEDHKMLEVETDDNVLYFGTLEGTPKVKGKKIVYDPQSPVNPKSFKHTGSSAEELTVVINFSEAKLLSKIPSGDIDSIKDYFFNYEKVNFLVLKMGAKGAIVFAPDGTQEIIPVYQTDRVWPIGSGDVFAASYAYFWFKGHTPVEAAKYASWNTACYCNSSSYNFKEFENGDFSPIIFKEFPRGQIYLAGPFFTFTQRWLVDQIFNSLKNMNLNVFSPWHHVGHGEASYVVPMDLEGLNNSMLVFAILDGLDSGTLFEVGYAIAKDMKIVGYVENETSESVKMLIGANCSLEKDLTTAIYKSFWELLE